MKCEAGDGAMMLRGPNRSTLLKVCPIAHRAHMDWRESNPVHCGERPATNRLSPWRRLPFMIE